jgi:hypothetical protein
MGRKSGIDKLPENIRSHIERRIRENEFTLDELIDDLRLAFPNESLPSRSALGRKRMAFDEMAKSMREIDAASRALVAELGEGFDDRGGALLAQAVTTLATNVAFQRLQDEPEELEIGDVLKLARTARAAQEARNLSLKERMQIEKNAKEKLLAEQKEKLAAMPIKGGVTEETKQAIRDALGIK